MNVVLAKHTGLRVLLAARIRGLHVDIRDARGAFAGGIKIDAVTSQSVR